MGHVQNFHCRGGCCGGCGRKVVDACCGGNLRTRWWTLAGKEAVKLKKKAFQAWQAQGSPKAAGTGRLEGLQLRKGKQGLAQAVFSRGEKLLTWTGDIVGQWKEHFEELLNPTNTSSLEEAESEDSVEVLSIHLAEVSEAVKKLLVLCLTRFHRANTFAKTALDSCLYCLSVTFSVSLANRFKV